MTQVQTRLLFRPPIYRAQSHDSDTADPPFFVHPSMVFTADSSLSQAVDLPARLLVSVELPAGSRLFSAVLGNAQVSRSHHHDTVTRRWSPPGPTQAPCCPFIDAFWGGRGTTAGIWSMSTSFNTSSPSEHSAKPETTELTECKADYEFEFTQTTPANAFVRNLSSS